MEFEEARGRAVSVTPVNYFEDFVVGREFVHHWGRTIFPIDNIVFGNATLAFNPLYFNLEYARKHGHPDLVVIPLLVYGLIIGLSVQDLTEGSANGGAFLGASDIRFLAPVHCGDTLRAFSKVLETRTSKSRPDAGIVTWQQWGLNQRDERVIEFSRTGLVIRRPVKT